MADSWNKRNKPVDKATPATFGTGIFGSSKFGDTVGGSLWNERDKPSASNVSTRTKP